MNKGGQGLGPRCAEQGERQAVSLPRGSPVYCVCMRRVIPLLLPPFPGLVHPLDIDGLPSLPGTLLTLQTHLVYGSSLQFCEPHLPAAPASVRLDFLVYFSLWAAFLLLLLLLSLCMVCVCYARTQVHMYAHGMRKLEVNLQHHSSGAIHLSFLRRDLSLA